MRATHRRLTPWSLVSVGLLILAIAVIGFRRTADKPHVPVATTSTAQPPQRPFVDTPETARRAEPDSEHAHQAASTAPATDFAAAMHAALQRGEVLNSFEEVYALGYRWVASDPEAALGFVLHLPCDNTLLLSALLNEWTRRAPAAAAAWAVSLPEETNRARVLPSMVAAWAESAPVDATRFAIELTPAAVQHDAIVSAVSGWSRQDPAAVLEWAGQLPPGKLQEQIFTQAAFTWGRRDPVSAAEWLRSQPDGHAWDTVASALSGALVERHPALALSLAAEISDATRRDQRLENIGRRWLATDRVAAEDALIRSDLPAPFVARLLR